MFPAPTTTTPLPGELVGAAVAGGVQQGSGEVGQTGKIGNVRPAEASGCRDQCPGRQPVPAGQVEVEGLPVPRRIENLAARSDRQVELDGVAAQVVGDLVPGRVSVRPAG